MHPNLTRCQALIESSIANLDDRTAAVRVGGRWSIAEIVEHLDRTYTGTSKGLTRCIESGAPRVSADSLRNRARRLWVVTLGQFPAGIEAPRHVVPSGELTLSTLGSRIGAHLTEMDDMLARAADRFGAGPIMDHPILGPFTVQHWARFHFVHTRHHCRQIAARRNRVATASYGL
jgi:hypothetical protein